MTSDAINKIIKDLKVKDLDDIYLALGSLRYTASYIINLTKTDKHQVNDAIFVRKNNTPKINYKSAILVDGADNIMVNLAKCCMPIKGDEIIGYITKGQGITVHKKSCHNVLGNDRIIDVCWNDTSTTVFYTNIYVVLKEKKDILVNIITEIGKKGSQVKSCALKELNDTYVYEININIKDKEELNTIKNALRKMPYVLDVKDFI